VTAPLSPGEWDEWFDQQPIAVVTDPMVAFVADMIDAGHEHTINTVQWRWFKEHVEDLGGWFE